MNVIIEIHVDDTGDLAEVAKQAVALATSGTETKGLIVLDTHRGYRVTMAPDHSRGEIHKSEAMEMSDEIGVEFRKGNGDYEGIAHAVEKKHGSGSLMLALRGLVGWIRREEDAAGRPSS